MVKVNVVELAEKGELINIIKINQRVFVVTEVDEESNNTENESSIQNEAKLGGELEQLEWWNGRCGALGECDGIRRDATDPTAANDARERLGGGRLVRRRVC